MIKTDTLTSGMSKVEMLAAIWILGWKMIKSATAYGTDVKH